MFICIAIILTSFSTALAASQEIAQENLKPFGNAIRIHEYQCPCAALGYYKGVFPQGQKFKIYCGPNEKQVYKNLVYEVILSPDLDTVVSDPDNGRIYVKPWKD